MKKRCGCLMRYLPCLNCQLLQGKERRGKLVGRHNLPHFVMSALLHCHLAGASKPAGADNRNVCVVSLYV